MSRKREPMASPWAQDRLLREVAPKLLDADEAAIDAKATELGVDPRRLLAFVNDARGRRRPPQP